MYRSHVPFACALAWSAAALSCTTVSSPDPVPSSGEPSSDSTAEERRAIAFTPCAEDPELECGTLEVPADYDHPQGQKLKLAVVRAPATGPGESLGPLFINQGGPGGTGVDFLFLLAHTRLAPLRERFDLVSFDPRGVGRSEPTVRCDFESPAPPIPGDLADRARYLDEHAQRFADACVAQSGPLVKKIGTNNVARDLDRFRAALGASKISYHGVSYGSELGAVYASLFPKRVRAMVLDGGVPAVFGDYTMEIYAEEAAAHELTLQRVDELCARAPSCPLQGRRLVDAVDELLARLRANPVPSPDDPTIVLREADAQLAISIMLFSDRNRWGVLPAMVKAALAGNYEEWFWYVFPPEQGVGADYQAYAAIFCTDLGARRPAADFLPQLMAIEAQYARLGKIAEMNLMTRTCHAWPVSDPPIFRNVADKVSTPILLVGNDFDPATPMNWTRNLARALGMERSVVRYQGGGHTATSIALRGVPCMDAVARRYLEDLEVPPAGFSCPALPISWAPLP
ncbi:MAG: alpha/beta hydrolase [Kofleriaceae bacterium]